MALKHVIITDNFSQGFCKLLLQILGSTNISIIWNTCNIQGNETNPLWKEYQISLQWAVLFNFMTVSRYLLVSTSTVCLMQHNYLDQVNILSVYGSSCQIKEDLKLSSVIRACIIFFSKIMIYEVFRSQNIMYLNMQFPLYIPHFSISLISTTWEDKEILVSFFYLWIPCGSYNPMKYENILLQSDMGWM